MAARLYWTSALYKKISSEGVNPHSKKHEGGMAKSAFDGRVESESGVGFVLMRLVGFGCHEDVFRFQHQILYKFSTFNAIFKDNTAINYVTV